MHRLQKGFTIIELIVTMAISALLMSVILFTYSSFTDKIALAAAGQEMAIAIRQAQTYGINVRETKPGAGNFNVAYGIYFKPSVLTNSYLIFADKDSDGLYDVNDGCGGTTTECVEVFTVRDSILISDICKDTFGVEYCQATSPIRELHITFVRPSPDAVINFTDGSGVIVYGNMPGGKIRLRSPRGLILTIYTENSGQISFQ